MNKSCSDQYSCSEMFAKEDDGVGYLHPSHSFSHNRETSSCRRELALLNEYGGIGKTYLQY